MKRLTAILLIITATPAMSQMTASRGSKATKASNAAVSTAGTFWEQMTSNIAKAAEQMPESDYSFRPVATVRTFGQLIGHVAGAQALICGSALGEKTAGEDDIEKSKTTKADLVAALKTTTEYCRKAYAMSDARSAGMTKLFGQDQTRLSALMLNATHNAEHYGNIVTYMRVKGMVPPSSQPATPRP